MDAPHSKEKAMNTTILRAGAILSVLALTALVAAGCNQRASEPTGKPAEVSETAHGGWWCAEHGIPEEECSMCSAKVAEACKAKGDWCKEHNRAESQCFICHPEKEAEFAALYEAKYGKKPPKPEAGGGKESADSES